MVILMLQLCQMEHYVLFRSTSKCAQIIVATQSVTRVNQFEPEDIVVDREKGQSVFYFSS